MNDTYDPSLDHPEHAAPDPPETRPVAAVMREGASHALDNIGDVLHHMQFGVSAITGSHPRVRTAEGYIAAAGELLRKALETLGPEPTDEGNES